MITQKAIVDGHRLDLDISEIVLEGFAKSNAPLELPTGSIAVDAFEFDFTGDDWTAATTKKACFWQNPNAIYPVTLDSNDIAVIPEAVLKDTGIFCMAVYGEYSNGGTDRRIATNAIRVKAVQGALTSENAPAPSVSLFEQAVSDAVEMAIGEIAEAFIPDENGSVSNANLAAMNARTLKGNIGASAASPSDIPLANLVMTGATTQRGSSVGFVPVASAGSLTRVLCADGTWKDITDILPIYDGSVI